MTALQRLEAFQKLGVVLEQYAKPDDALCGRLRSNNQWFTNTNIATAIAGIRHLLQPKALEQWFSTYEKKSRPAKHVGVIMAGNIPCVGFHDMLCVLLSGHNLVAKVSSDDAQFPKWIAGLLLDIAPEFATQIQWAERLNSVEALIATGSDNTAMHLNYYFSKVPRLLRRNRTSIAILNGTETVEQLGALGLDIFTYFGLGCRNVSKVFVPQGYVFDGLFEAVYAQKYVMDHKKYMNNYEYHRALYLLNSDVFLDNNFFIIKPDTGLFSPVGVLYQQAYESMDTVLDFIGQYRSQIQCIVQQHPVAPQIAFGATQYPSVNDYADGVDTMAFLTGLQ